MVPCVMRELTRELVIDFIAGRVIDALNAFFDGADKDFALEEVVRVCRARRTRAKSSAYRLSFERDEAPTNPDTGNSGRVDIGARETREVNIDDIQRLIKEKKDKGEL